MIAVGNARKNQSRLSTLAYPGNQKPPAVKENDLLSSLFCYLSAFDNDQQFKKNSFLHGTKLECY
jgi:hypothetical protein